MSRRVLGNTLVALAGCLFGALAWWGLRSGRSDEEQASAAAPTLGADAAEVVPVGLAGVIKPDVLVRGGSDAPLERSARGATFSRHRLRLIDEDGAPLGGLLVRARYRALVVRGGSAGQSGGAALAEYRASEDKGTRRTDADGGLAVPLWSGGTWAEVRRVELVLTEALDPAGRELCLRDARLALRSGADLGTNVFEVGGVLAAGRVLDGLGRPLELVELELWPEDAGEAWPLDTELSDPWGRFGFLGGFGIAAHERVELRLKSPGRRLREPVWIEPGARGLELMLELTDGARGRLLLDESFRGSGAQLAINGPLISGQGDLRNPGDPGDPGDTSGEPGIFEQPDFELVREHPMQRRLALQLGLSSVLIASIEGADPTVLDLGVIDARDDWRALKLEFSGSESEQLSFTLTSVDPLPGRRYRWSGGYGQVVQLEDGRAVLWAIAPTEAFPILLKSEGYEHSTLSLAGPVARAIELRRLPSAWIEVRTPQDLAQGRAVKVTLMERGSEVGGERGFLKPDLAERIPLPAGGELDALLVLPASNLEGVPSLGREIDRLPLDRDRLERSTEAAPYVVEVSAEEWAAAQEVSPGEFDAGVLEFWNF